MWGFIRRLFCPHDYSITAESGVMLLRCAVCGHKTRGWPLHSGIDDVAQPTARPTHGSAPSSIVSVTSPSVSPALGSSPSLSVVPNVGSSVSPLVNPSPAVSPSASRAGATTRCRVLPGPQTKSIAPSVEAGVPKAEVPKATVEELTKSGVKVVSVGERDEATTSNSGLQTRVANALAALDRVRKTDHVVARRNSRKHRESSNRRLPFVESPLRLAVSSSSISRDLDHEGTDAVATEPEAASLSGELDVNAASKSGYQVG